MQRMQELPVCQIWQRRKRRYACKQKRRMYLLREGEMLPIIMTLPTGSLAEFTKYVTRLVTVV